MTRKRLWSLTALACVLMAIPSLPLKAIGYRLSALGDRRSTIDLTSLLDAARDPRLAAVLTVISLLLLTITVIRARRTPADLATALARRGTAVAAIARKTRLSQDAIRDLLGGEPMAVSTESRGRFFRRRPKSSAPASASFAEELSEKSFDARG